MTRVRSSKPFNEVFSKSRSTPFVKPFFVLAPMDDVTETVFRQIVQRCAPADLYFTEFVNVDGLQSPGRTKLLKKMRFSLGEGPLVAQLWGLKPENFEITAREIADGTLARELGLPAGANYVGIDLNMGCPAKSEVKNGTCSALINNRELAHEIIEATKKGAAQGAATGAAQGAPAGAGMPVSVKTRLGWNEIDFSWPEFLLGHNLAMLTIHGRTRKEMSKVPAHWDAIGEISKLRDDIAPETLLIGNGDVNSFVEGTQLAKKHNLDGIMIGRGVFNDPYVFAAESPWENISREDRITLFIEHVTLFAETWQPDERKLHTLNKFCKVYINGFDGAKELREQLMDTSTSGELLSILNKELVS